MAERRTRQRLPHHDLHADREPLLREPRHARIVTDALFWMRDQGRIRLHGFVIMPDHVHCALALEPGSTLRRVLQTLKGFTARQINLKRKSDRSVWQEQYRDNRMTDYEEVRCAILYIHENPVRAGLVSQPEEYAFSGAHPRFRNKLDAW